MVKSVHTILFPDVPRFPAAIVSVLVTQNDHTSNELLPLKVEIKVLVLFKLTEFKLTVYKT